MDLVKQQPKKEINFPYLKVGEVKLFNCSASIEDDLKTLEILDTIFHRKNKKKKIKVPGLNRKNTTKKDKEEENMENLKQFR